MLKKVREILGGNDEFIAATAVFPEIDRNRIAKDLQLADEGKARGLSDRPESDAKVLDHVEQQVISKVEDLRRRGLENYEQFRRVYSERLSRATSARMEVERSARHASSRFKQNLIAYRARMVAPQNRLQDAYAYREQFRRENKLGIRPAQKATPGIKLFFFRATAHHLRVDTERLPLFAEQPTGSTGRRHCGLPGVFCQCGDLDAARTRGEAHSSQSGKHADSMARVLADIERQLGKVAEGALRQRLLEMIVLVNRLLAQKPKDKGKLYSLHEPAVDCISKGKARKRYEFGTKVSVATTNRGGLVVGMRALPGNPYDGHTLHEALEQVEILTAQRPEMAFVDRGYRGHGVEHVKVFISGAKRGVTRTIARLLRRRSAIEPMIGHMKNDVRLTRCPLKGTEGDAFFAVLCGCGHNIRMILSYLREVLCRLLWLHSLLRQISLARMAAVGPVQTAAAPP